MYEVNFGVLTEISFCTLYINMNRPQLLWQYYKKCIIDILIFFSGTSSGISPIIASFVQQVAVFFFLFVYSSLNVIDITNI